MSRLMSKSEFESVARMIMNAHTEPELRDKYAMTLGYVEGIQEQIKYHELKIKELQEALDEIDEHEREVVKQIMEGSLFKDLNQ